MLEESMEFSLEAPDQKVRSRRPLAERMRPVALSEVLGQQHLLGGDCLLPKLIRENRVGNILLAGPPGTGKTTLAFVIAREGKCKLLKVNAVTSNVAELRETLKLARYHGADHCYLFVDEIHRFNKAQQDLLLPDIESGEVRLIGATTHNPRYYIIEPLLSRSHLFTLKSLGQEEIVEALAKCLSDTDRGLGERKCTAQREALSDLALFAEGDMRRAYNLLETLVEGLPNGAVLGNEDVSAFAQERGVRYDRDEDEHYDTASALIKSMRGNDPDAAVYWLAKMLAGGEDPRFIARRLVIFASEDIGLADSRALLMADAAFRACETIGLPECELNLAHVVLFLATCLKSNSATLAIAEAKRALREQPGQSVPSSVRDRHGRNRKDREEGEEGYLYSHEFPENVSGQQYLEKPLDLYRPKSSGAESAIAERLEKWKALRDSLNK